LRTRAELSCIGAAGTGASSLLDSTAAPPPPHELHPPVEQQLEQLLQLLWLNKPKRSRPQHFFFLQQESPQGSQHAVSASQLGSQASAHGSLQGSQHAEAHGSQQESLQHGSQQPQSNKPCKPSNNSRIGWQHFLPQGSQHASPHGSHSVVASQDGSQASAQELHPPLWLLSIRSSNSKP